MSPIDGSGSTPASGRRAIPAIGKGSPYGTPLIVDVGMDQLCRQVRKFVKMSTENETYPDYLWSRICPKVAAGIKVTETLPSCSLTKIAGSYLQCLE